MKRLDRLYIGLLLIIFGGIVLHAPLSVIFGTLFPELELIVKAWKEILMVVAGMLLLVILKRRQRFNLLRDPLLVAIAVYAALTVLLIPLFWQGLQASLAGVMIDLRYLLYFVLVYLALRLYPDWRNLFIKIGIVGAVVVMVFGVLQVTVLPKDALKYIGYGESTIMPYLTVDENPDYVRISSTMRGPNPLGAYAAIVLTAVAAYVLKGKLGKTRRPQIIAGILAASALVCLWASYSRSALAAALIALGIVFALTIGRKLSRKVWLVGSIVAIAVAAGTLSILTVTHNDVISNVILHENSETGGAISSNEGHASSVQVALTEVATKPLGGGIGSTGSASLFGPEPLIIENQYLFVAHEVGWIGLLVFVLIWLGVLTRLWQGRRDWLALAVFASGVGIALIGLLQPVWADDTVAIIWWGLAAVALTKGLRS